MDELLSKEFVHEVYGFAQAQGSKIDVPEADMVELWILHAKDDQIGDVLSPR